jgi:dTDP-4-dehydrorhamnose 3,5-epimerase
MKLIQLGIPGVWLAESNIFHDDRGNFREWFHYNEIKQQSGIEFLVKQANTSVSNKNVIRGIHYSLFSGGQAKWVTCTNGSLLDVVIDIRQDSPTFLKKIYVELNSKVPTSLLISSGLGHGFLSFQDNTVVTYLLNSEYQPEFEHRILPTDTKLDINWNFQNKNDTEYIISNEDKSACTLVEMEKAELLPKFF